MLNKILKLNYLVIPTATMRLYRDIVGNTTANSINVSQVDTAHNIDTTKRDQDFHQKCKYTYPYVV